MPINEMNKKYNSIEKCLYILSCFSTENSSMSLDEISEKTNFNITTTYRNLQTLIDFGYISRRMDRKYCIGPSFVYLSAVANKDLELSQV